MVACHRQGLHVHGNYQSVFAYSVDSYVGLKPKHQATVSMAGVAVLWTCRHSLALVPHRVSPGHFVGPSSRVRSGNDRADFRNALFANFLVRKNLQNRSKFGDQIGQGRLMSYKKNAPRGQ